MGTMQIATVEKVGNGFVVDFGAEERRVATDALMLAEVFEAWPALEVRIDLTESGMEALKRSGLLRTGDDPALTPGPSPDSSVAGEGSVCTCTNNEAWHEGGCPALKPDPARPSVEPGTGNREPGTDEVTRAPIADDGYEYPPVRQEGPNHFVINCPNHGEQRMTRNGADWVCTGKTNKQACGVAIPSTQMRRALRRAA